MVIVIIWVVIISITHGIRRKTPIPIKMIPIAASIPFMTVDGMKWVKPPNLNMPSNTCISPATATERKKISIVPSSVMADAQMAVRPAAGPLTLIWDLLINPTTIPPRIPEISPE